MYIKVDSIQNIRILLSCNVKVMVHGKCSC